MDRQTYLFRRFLLALVLLFLFFPVFGGKSAFSDFSFRFFERLFQNEEIREVFCPDESQWQEVFLLENRGEYL